MALDKIEQVRLRIYDIPKNIFYPIFTDAEYEQFLEDSNGNVLQAAKTAAISASMFFVTMNTKEMVGDTEIWSEISKQYLRALEMFLLNNRNVIIGGLMPYAPGVSNCDLAKSANDRDNPRAKNWLYKDKTGCEHLLSLPLHYPPNDDGGCCV